MIKISVSKNVVSRSARIICSGEFSLKLQLARGRGKLRFLGVIKILKHIFSSPLLLLKARRRLLTKPEINAMGRIPNEHLGSDHLALQAMFTLYSEPVPYSFGRNEVNA